MPECTLWVVEVVVYSTTGNVSLAHTYLCDIKGFQLGMRLTAKKGCLSVTGLTDPMILEAYVVGKDAV